jgi:hypothetical protein
LTRYWLQGSFPIVPFYLSRYIARPIPRYINEKKTARRYIAARVIIRSSFPAYDLYAAMRLRADCIALSMQSARIVKDRAAMLPRVVLYFAET